MSCQRIPPPSFAFSAAAALACYAFRSVAVALESLGDALLCVKELEAAVAGRFGHGTYGIHGAVDTFIVSISSKIIIFQLRNSSQTLSTRLSNHDGLASHLLSEPCPALTKDR